MTHEVPYIPKKTVTIIAVDDASATALRAVLEVYNYRVTTHWVGSRKEFIMLLDGSLPLDDDFVVLCCHGDEQGIVVPGEPHVTAEDVSAHAKLNGKAILGLGCRTGSSAFREAFKQSGAKAYVAPNDYPDGSSALAFAAIFGYELQKGTGVDVATERAASLDDETRMFA